MKTAIIVSTKDFAGMNIRSFLVQEDLGSLNAELYVIDIDTIYAEDLDKKIDADLFIFASRHSSKEGIRCLSCHVPGNFGKAEAGGVDEKLCVAPASVLKDAFVLLNEFGKVFCDEITLECTHHGPFIHKPALFVEIGSTEKEWKDPVAGKIVAQVILKLLKNHLYKNNYQKKYKIAFGIGGPHYCNNFNKVQLGSDVAVGHVCPKYQLKGLDKEMILHAMSKTFEKIDYVLLDWKGMVAEKQRIRGLLESLGIEFRRTDQV